MSGSIGRSGRGAPRPRVSNACQNCRRRKVKCNLGRPACSRCVAAGAQCSYDGEQFIEYTTEATQSPPIETSTRKLQQLEEKLESLTELVKQLRQDESESSSKRRRTLRGNSPAYDPGYLSSQAGKTRYISKSHWTSVLDEVHEIDDLIREQERYEVFTPVSGGSVVEESLPGLLGPPPAWQESGRHSSKTQTRMAPIEIPPKAACDALIEACLVSVYHMVPVFSIPDFKASYDKVWREERNANVNDPLLMAILYAGAVVCASDVFLEHFHAETRAQVATDLYYKASMALKWSSFPRSANMETLAAYYYLALMWLREEEPLTNLNHVGVLVRVAQMLGLNRDPSNFPDRFSQSQAELRRLVWWQIFQMDVGIAIAAGLPPLIDRESSDVRMLTDQSNMTASGEIDITPCSVFWFARLKAKLLERDILDWTYSAFPMNANKAVEIKEKLERLQHDLEGLILKMPRKSKDEYYTNNKFVRPWARIYTSSLADRDWWFLYLATVNQDLGDVKDELLSLAEKHSRSFLEKYACMASLDRFARVQWSVPGIFQPLQATMVLLKQLERDQGVEEPEELRRTVDEIIALCDTDGGVVAVQGTERMLRPLTEGGSEAWRVVKRLRERVWKKLDWDPDLLPSREEVAASARIRCNNLFPAPEGDTIESPIPPARFYDDNNANMMIGTPALPTPSLNWNELDILFADWV